MKDIKAKLQEVTGRSEEECIKIDEILNSHFLIGHNNKDKFIADFEEKLGIDHEEANQLYNQCMESVVGSIFKRNK